MESEEYKETGKMLVAFGERHDTVVLYAKGICKDAVQDLGRDLDDWPPTLVVVHFPSTLMIWEGVCASEDDYVFEGSWRKLTAKELQRVNEGMFTFTP